MASVYVSSVADEQVTRDLLNKLRAYKALENVKGERAPSEQTLIEGRLALQMLVYQSPDIAVSLLLLAVNPDAEPSAEPVEVEQEGV